MSLAPGAHLGRYEILGPIGAGGMGEVHRARDLTLHREVAIKILPPAFAGDADRLARFLREAQTLAALNHPNIATIYGVEESAGGVHALVMELVEGDDLSSHIARAPMPLDDVLPIARQIAEALEAAHEQGIVHRDLKPANIKVRPDGTVKVLDFGLAKARHADPGTVALANSPTFSSPPMTEQGVILGTAAYMAPEQAKGRPADKRADIWSFGVVLYEMLTGARPFQRDSVTETLAAVLTHDPDLDGLSRSAPPAVVRLLRRCLERDPKRRLRDIGEARLILSDTHPGDDESASAAQVEQRPRRLLSAAAFVAVACAAGLAGALIVGRNEGSRPAPPAMTTNPITTSGSVISAAISPDGRYVAYVESEQGLQSLWLQQVDGGQTLRLIPPRGVGYWSQTFTPDGNHIVFGVRTQDDVKGTLYSISTLGGKPTVLTKGMDSVPTYSPDGSRMAFLLARHPTNEESALMVAGADGSNPRMLTSVKLPESVAEIFFGGPSWSPDGKVIVTAVNRRASTGVEVGGRLVQISVDTGAMTTLADPGWLRAAQAGWLPDGKSLLVIAQAPDQLASQIWSVSYPGGEARRVTGDLNEHRIISLTRDGRTLVSVADTLSLNILAMPLRDGGPPVRVSRSTFDGQNGVAFARDGGIVYSSRSTAGSSLWRTSADGADRGPAVAAAEGEYLRYPTVTDDGTIVYVASTRAGHEIRSTSHDGSSTRVLARNVLAGPVTASADGKVIVYGAALKGVNRLLRISPDDTSPKELPTVAASDAALDPSGQRVAFYYINAEGRFRFGVAPIDGGALLADLPAEIPARTARLALRAEGLYVNTMPGDRANVWLLPLDGGPARKVTSFADQTIFDFALSRDGASLAVVRGSRLRDAQLIRGFDGGGE
jgi:Tol biopolymer transport system component